MPLGRENRTAVTTPRVETQRGGWEGGGRWAEERAWCQLRTARAWFPG